MFNTYAWFIYATKVDTSLSVHVSSWNVEFVSLGGESIKDLVIEVERIYPGMETFEKTMPETLEALERYLSGGIISGVGPATAKKIIDKF